MSGFFDIYSIIFLIIAVVIFMRLGSVLGRRTGNEPSPFDPRLKTPAGARNDNVVALPPGIARRRPRPRRPISSRSSRYAAPGTPAYDGAGGDRQGRLPISIRSISSSARRRPTR